MTSTSTTGCPSNERYRDTRSFGLLFGDLRARGATRLNIGFESRYLFAEHTVYRSRPVVHPLGGIASNNVSDIKFSAGLLRSQIESERAGCTDLLQGTEAT